MARLIYAIDGDITGLTNAVNSALNLIKKLNTEASKIKFGAEGLSGLGAAIAGATSKTNEFTKAVDKNSQAFKDKTAATALENLGTKLNVINANVQLFGSSLQTNQQTLRAFQTALNQLVASGVDPLDKRVTALKANIVGFNTAIANEKALKAGNGGGLFGSIGGQIAGVVAGYTSLFAIIGGVKHVIDFNAEISDSLANVRRTAGLTSEEVNNLNDTLKKIDTRTSLKGLLDIAVIAGQLGIAKDQIAGFTKSIDQLAVTLGDELKGGPKEIAESLGILDKVFGVTVKNGGNIERSFNQIGSVILGLGQSGLATGDFLAEFAKRVGGVAAQAKLSLPVLLSYGATLQEQGVQSEVAGTAFKRLISSLATKRGAFLAVAQIADSSLTLEKFTDIINNDTQQALTLFFRGLAKGGTTTTQFQQLLKSVGLDAARSGQAIAALAFHQDDLTRHIAESTKQFQEGSLAIDQFKIKNDTLAGSLAKLTNAFNNLFQSENGISKFFKTLSDGATQAINHLAGLDKFKGGVAIPVQAVLLSTGSQNRNIANDINTTNTKIIKEDATLEAKTPNGFAGQSLDQLRALIPKYQSIALEARSNFLKFANAIKKGQVTDPTNALGEFSQRAVGLNNTYKDLIATFNAANTGQTKTIAKIKELTDAELTSIPQIKARIKELTGLSDSGILGSDTNLRIRALNERLKELRGTGGSIRNVFNDIANSIADLIAKSNALAASTGLTGYAAEVQKVASEFATLNAGFDKVKANIAQGLRSGRLTPGRAATLTSRNNTGQQQLGVNEQRALDAALIAEREKFNTDLQGIDDAFGVKQEQSRKAELAAVQKLANDKIAVVSKGIFTQQQIEDQFNASVSAAKGNKDQIATATKVRDAEILAAQESAIERERINSGVLSAQDAINQKYLTKERELQDSIASLRDVALEDLSDKETNATNKIVAGWDKRKVEAAKYFDQLRTIYPELSAIITKQQQSTNALFDAAKFRDVSVELSKNFATAMQAGVNTLAQDFFTQITGLGAARQAIDDKYRDQYAQATDALTKKQIAEQEQIEKSATTSFGAIFSSLISSSFASFNKSILDSLTKRFTENLGTTLIKPNADQLGLKVSGQQFSSTVVNAGESFRAQIDAAAQAIAVRVNPALLNGASGGAALAGNNELAASSAGGQVAGSISTAGADFNQEVTSAGASVGSALNEGAASAAATTTTAASTAGATIKTAGAGLSAKIAGAAAALSLVGGLISGATSPTSFVGQGIGGALQGAGEGALIGSVIPGLGTVAGAVIGGVIGGISGLFSASKAKKQEELQQKQLEQQQETNALLARQNALAYTSSIIGRMTTQGIITGADISAFGELTAKISGKDVQFVLSRNSNGR